MRLRAAAPRRGITLIETMLAATILFITVVSISQLSSMTWRRVNIVRDQSRAIQVCQAKLNEVVAGALGMTGANGDCDDELPGWEWSVETEQHQVVGLWQVRVTVKPKDSDDPTRVVTLDQIVLDPSKRGSAMDEIVVATTDDTAAPDSGTSGQPGGTGAGTGGGTGGSTGGGTRGGTGGGTRGGTGGGTGGGTRGGSTGGGGRSR